MTSPDLSTPLSSERDGKCLPISDYAIIGDSRTAALVARDGSIDWYCWPEFDSSALLCRLLDARRGGYFQIAPTGQFSSTRAYLDSTNVLVTTFQAAGGTARITDLMLVFPDQDRTVAVPPPTIVRVVEGVSGEVEVEVRFCPTFGFSQTPTRVTPVADGALAEGDRTRGKLFCPIPLQADREGGARGTGKIAAGQRLICVLVCGLEHGPELALPSDVDQAIHATIDYWRAWAKVCQYQGEHRDLVLRSALVLKLLMFRPSGALVAAPTTSLPEVIGGVRNWDYRFTWLRDSALILESLELVGYTQEAEHFFEWLRRVWLTKQESMQIMYGISGEPVPPERNLEFLSGYQGSRPVRVGNAAADQIQLDVYGEVMEAAHYVYGRQHPPSAEVWEVLRSFADDAARRWKELDRGIWEERGEPRPFLYSRVLCWTALQRAIDLVHQHQLPADLDTWRHARDAIKREVLAKGFNPKLNAFTQYIGGDELDASALVIPIVGFLSPTDPRVLSTIEAIQKRLPWHGLLLRYTTADGVPGGDSAFVLCSFWLVDDLTLAGRVDEAKQQYAKITSFCNDVGLLSEEVDPIHGQLLGNFPQGFSHLGIIRSAYYIARAERDGALHQPTNRLQRVGAAKQAGAKTARKS